MESSHISTQFVSKLATEIGILKSDCIYKDVVINSQREELEHLREENRLIQTALKELVEKNEALMNVKTYTIDEAVEEDEQDIDESLIDQCFVCE